ncbi:mitogen-activated protein kinase kinase kinase 14-like [Plakobranchus ocellatus]|uniref:Mitogen-activated protein kinase kinase kinase 14-like n=2 Tax=Plakobranchus ocellatus TaxID=259542 RepID=A0AAV4B5K4_9GAST|nr:mitogen-activated protein kinase kinase kinase 14-like [Plakobranchus ocellatus]
MSTPRKEKLRLIKELEILGYKLQQRSMPEESQEKDKFLSEKEMDNDPTCRENTKENLDKEWHESLEKENQDKEWHKSVEKESLDKEWHESLEKENLDKEWHKSLEKESLDKEWHESLEKENLDKEWHKSVEKESLDKEWHGSLEKENQDKERHGSLEKENLDKEWHGSLEKENQDKECHESVEKESLDKECYESVEKESLHNEWHDSMDKLAVSMNLKEISSVVEEISETGDRDDKKMSKRLDEFINEIIKLLKHHADKTIFNKFLVLAASAKLPIMNDYIKIAENDKLGKDSNKFEEEQCAETSIKEYCTDHSTRDESPFIDETMEKSVLKETKMAEGRQSKIGIRIKKAMLEEDNNRRASEIEAPGCCKYIGPEACGDDFSEKQLEIVDNLYGEKGSHDEMDKEYLSMLKKLNNGSDDLKQDMDADLLKSLEQHLSTCPTSDEAQQHLSRCPTNDGAQQHLSTCPTDGQAQQHFSRCPTNDEAQQHLSTCPTNDEAQQHFSLCPTSDEAQQHLSRCPTNDEDQQHLSRCHKNDEAQRLWSRCPTNDEAHRFQRENEENKWEAAFDNKVYGSLMWHGSIQAVWSLDQPPSEPWNQFSLAFVGTVARCVGLAQNIPWDSVNISWTKESLSSKIIFRNLCLSNSLNFEEEDQSRFGLKSHSGHFLQSIAKRRFLSKMDKRRCKNSSSIKKPCEVKKIVGFSEKIAGCRRNRRGHFLRKKQQKQLSRKRVPSFAKKTKAAYLKQEAAKFRTCSGSNDGHSGRGGVTSSRGFHRGGSGKGGWTGGTQSSQGSGQGHGSGDDDDPDDHNRRYNKKYNVAEINDDTKKDEGKEKDQDKSKSTEEKSHGKSNHCYDRNPPQEGFFIQNDALSLAAAAKNVTYDGDPKDQRRRSDPNQGGARPRHNDVTWTGPIPSSAPVLPLSVPDDQTKKLRNQKEHAVISPTQLCEALGSAESSHVPPELFKHVNVCLSKAMHDLTFCSQEFSESLQLEPDVEEGQPEVRSTVSGERNKNVPYAASDRAASSTLTATTKTSSAAQDDMTSMQSAASASLPIGNSPSSPCSPQGCTVCLVLSGLLTHLSQDRGQRECQQCAQILNLMTQHARDCVAERRPRQRITSSDLCYKICKKAEWSEEKICCAAKNFREKIKKYCDKALCKSTESAASEAGSSFAISEMECSTIPELLSPGASISTNFSSSEKPAAGESERHSLDKTPMFPSSKVGRDLENPASFAFEPLRAKSHNLSPLANSNSHTTSSQQTAPSVSVSGLTHRSLTRKGSQKTPAIPQSIQEESTCAEEELGAAGGQVNKEDVEIRDIIYKRFGPKGLDPYDTQPTFGDKKGFESMPQGMLHDQEQFFSFGNRAVGVPGIGEVVFGNLKQLRLVAGFWEKKREDCERTGTNPPYQHREEGVILSQYKNNFSILRTRYQKHHQWDRVAHLGNGMSGKCHLVMDHQTNFKFCCKKVHLLKYTKEEVNLWSELTHRFIVKLYGAIRHGVKIYIFCEFIDGGSLAACIEEQKRLRQRVSHWSAINYFHQLLQVLDYLQSQDILHEDIKADNILLRNGSTYMALTDFGTSRRLCDPRELRHKSPVGSPAHWSPEKAASQGHGFPADLWAALCVLIHMLSGDPPWMRRFMKSATILNFIIFSREPPLEDVPANVQPMVRDLLASGLVKDAGARPSAKKLLGHEAFGILAENTKPDRFYSSLITQSCALLPKPGAAERKTQGHNQADGGDCKILYSEDIPTGPYQESDTRNENQGEHQTSRGLEEHSAEDEEASEGQYADEQRLEEQPVRGETRGNMEEDFPGDHMENIPTRLNEASLSPPSGSCIESQPETKRHSLGMQVPNLKALLLVPDESRAFYMDEVPNGTEALQESSSKQQQLEVFAPEGREAGDLPNLSIFNEKLSGVNKSSPRAKAISQLSASNIDEQLRVSLSSARFADNTANGTISFNLSSGSEEFTSADLFDLGSMGGPETLKNNTTDAGAQGAEKTAQAISLSPPVSGTNLQQRKPYDLKLNLSPTGESTNAVGSSGFTNKKQELNWLGQPHKTPSTGRHSASSSRLGSGASGSHASPSFPFRFSSPSSSIPEEQDKMMQMLKAEQESLSSSGSEKFNDIPADDQGASHFFETDLMDWRSALSTLQSNIDSNSLEGHELVLFDEISRQKVLSVRLMERPITKRYLLENISGRLMMSYPHFTLCHMDKTPLKLDEPLQVHKVLVRKLTAPQKGCLCNNCRSQF